MPDEVASCGVCEDEVGRGDLYAPASDGQVLLCADCAESRAELQVEQTRDAYRSAQRRLATIQKDRLAAN
jgi:F0F1-type ATP synthase epsilon subunit